MNILFDKVGGRASHGLMEEAAGDIVLRLDPSGFVLHASANADELGIDLASLLVMPHISDFAEPGYGDAVARHTATMLRNEPDESAPTGIGGAAKQPKSFGPGGGEARSAGGWIEFPLRRHGRGSAPRSAAKRRWFALSLRAIAADDGTAHGALALLRPAERHHRLERQARARASTDLSTGLDNRAAFGTSLRRCFADPTPTCVAVLAIDRMQAIAHRYGQAAADEVRWGFARFLEAMTIPEHSLAQLDAERFAVILPGQSVREARAWAEDVLHTFAALLRDDLGSNLAGVQDREPRLTISAGIARAELNTHWTLRQAELGLVMARAAGGMRAAARGKRRGPREAAPLPRLVPTNRDEPNVFAIQRPPAAPFIVRSAA